MAFKRMVVLLTTLAVFGAADRAYADFCVSYDVTVNFFGQLITAPVGYQLQVGTAAPAAGTPIVVTGVKVFPATTPLLPQVSRESVFGSLRITSTGDVVIALNIVSDTSGIPGEESTYPIGIALFKFPAGGSPTFVTTYTGIPSPVLKFQGPLRVVACPIDN